MWLCVSKNIYKCQICRYKKYRKTILKNISRWTFIQKDYLIIHYRNIAVCLQWKSIEKDTLSDECFTKMKNQTNCILICMFLVENKSQWGRFKKSKNQNKLQIYLLNLLVIVCQLGIFVEVFKYTSRYLVCFFLDWPQ